MTTFKKGQLVTFLQNWDDCGTVRIINLIVHSCGSKQMILVDETGNKFEGKIFRPTEEQVRNNRVISRLSINEANVTALSLGAEIVAYERARINDLLIRNASAGKGYINALKTNLTKLHDPRIFRS